MNMGMEYGASWSMALTARTIIMMFLAPFLAFGLFVAMRLAFNSPLAFDVAIGSIPALVAIAYLLRGIRGFVVSRDAIFVRHLLWTRHEPLAGLRSAEVDPEALTGAESLHWLSGRLGTAGWYWSARFGRFRGYLTNRRRLVVLRLERGAIVLSPDDPDAFVRHVESFKGQTVG